MFWVLHILYFGHICTGWDSLFYYQFSRRTDGWTNSISIQQYSDTLESTLSFSGKGVKTALYGPPALPDSLEKMQSASLVTYCKELIEFEKALNPGLSQQPPWASLEPVDIKSDRADAYYRSMVSAFFSHYSLDIK